MTLFRFYGDSLLYKRVAGGYYPITLGDHDRMLEAAKVSMLRVVQLPKWDSPAQSWVGPEHTAQMRKLQRLVA